MLVRSNLNKILLFFIIFVTVFACAKKKPERIFNTEILCPNNVNILVKYVRMQDVSDAIKKFLEIKKKGGTSENYTILRFKDKRSLRIEKIPPEKMIQCYLRETDVGIAEQWYYHTPKRP